MLKKFLWVLLSLILLIGIVCISGYVYYSKNITTLNTTPVEFEVTKGSSVNKVATELESQNVIKKDLILRIYYKLNGKGTGFLAGEYLLEPQMSFEDLVHKFESGDVIPVETTKVVIQEGLTTDQVLQKLSNELGLDKGILEDLVVNGEWDYWFLEGIEKDEHRLDGFLFPDTYEFAKNMSEKDVLTRILNHTEKVLDKYKEDIENSKMSARSVMTLASLVEKEARHDEDRPDIAGVIYNRLEENMLLQIDATVLAVVGHKQIVTYEDLKVDSPYNTYKYKGLPPSPIAMPGEESIKAALHPNEHDYFYYVANRKTGYHHFAETYKEHQENIDKYWKKKD